MAGKFFECEGCAEEVEVPDTVPTDEVDKYLEDAGWKHAASDPVKDEWLCPDCQEGEENG